MSYYLNFDNVTKSQWEEAYAETLEMLQKFPIPLFCRKIKKRKGGKRMVFSTDLLRYRGKPNEQWDVLGDLLSMKYAENFVFERHLFDRIKRNWDERTTSPPNASVFFTDPGYDYGDAQFGVNIFTPGSRKTQGYPYHLAILAVCTLLENKFEGQSYTSGDFDELQADEVVKWLEATYDRPFHKAICTDAPRLWQALMDTFHDEKRAIERFLDLTRLDNDTSYRHLAQLCSREALLDVLAEDLSSFDSLDQYGAINICMDVLNIWQDVDLLLDFVALSNSKKQTDDKAFDIAILLQKLCSEFVFVPPMEKENFRLLELPKENLQTIDDQIVMFLLAMVGHRKKEIYLYIPKEEIWMAFLSREPKRAEAFKAIMDEAEVEIQKHMDDLKKAVEMLDSELEEIAARQGEVGTSEAEADSDDLLLLQYPPSAHYIVAQCLRQKERFHDLGTLFATFGKHFNKPIAEVRDPNLDVHAMRLGMYAASMEHGLTLTENAWAAIDALDDPELLHMLYGLCMVTDRSYDFWKLRLILLEHPEHWQRIKQGK